MPVAMLGEAHTHLEGLGRQYSMREGFSVSFAVFARLDEDRKSNEGNDIVKYAPQLDFADKVVMRQ